MRQFRGRLRDWSVVIINNVVCINEVKSEVRTKMSKKKRETKESINKNESTAE